METRPFRILHPEDPRRVIRGKLDLPDGAPTSRAGWPHACVLHGFKGFMDWGFFPDIARRLAGAGIAAVRFNVSGSGVGEDLLEFDDLEGFERNTLTRELEDIAAVRAWIRGGGATGVDPERRVWIGHSRGGGLALVHAAETGDGLGIVTWATVATFDRFDAVEKQRCRRDGFLPIRNARTGQVLRLGAAAFDDLERNRARFDVPAACRRLRVPVLLVHGSDDETVPALESDVLAAALDPGRVSVRRIVGAGHTFGIRHPMASTTDAWKEVAEATISSVREYLT